MPGNNQSNTIDSTLLRKYVELDLGMPSGSDTGMVITISYDDLKRVKRVEENDHSSTLPFIMTTDYFYNGTDTLPYKTAWWAIEDTYVYRDTTFYWYANGVVTKDSSVGGTGTHKSIDIQTFAVSANKVMVYRSDKDYEGALLVYTSEVYDTITFRKQNGNIAEETSVIDDVSYKRYRAMVYNDKPDPFFKTAIHYPVLYMGINSYGQRNLWTDEVWGYDAATPVRQYRLNYTYRRDGYPLTITGEDVLNPGPNEWKGIYLYY